MKFIIALVFLLVYHQNAFSQDTKKYDIDYPPDIELEKMKKAYRIMYETILDHHKSLGQGYEFKTLISTKYTSCKPRNNYEEKLNDVSLHDDYEIKYIYEYNKNGKTVKAAKSFHLFIENKEPIRYLDFDKNKSLPYRFFRFYDLPPNQLSSDYFASFLMNTYQIDIWKDINEISVYKPKGKNHYQISVWFEEEMDIYLNRKRKTPYRRTYIEFIYESYNSYGLLTEKFDLAPIDKPNKTFRIDF